MGYKLFVMMIFFFTLSFSTTEINISGIVKDSITKQPIEGANVNLVRLKINTLTDNTGKFVISGTSIFKNNFSKSSVEINGGEIIYIQRTNSPVAIFICDLSGRCIETVFSGILEEGIWQISPPPYLRGMFLLMVKTFQGNTTYRFLNLSNRKTSIVTKLSKIENVIYQTKEKRNASNYIDSLLITKNGYRSKVLPIESYQMSGLDILLEDTTSSTTVDDATIIPDPSWTCFMPNGIPPPKLGENVFKIVMQISAIHKVGNTKFGYRRQIDITGGTISGSKISGTILSGGLDYELTLSTGSMEIEQIAILRAGSTYILMRNAGVAPTGAKYARMVLDFEAPNSSSYTWLHQGKYVAHRIVDTVSKTITLDVYDVSNVKLPEKKVQIKDPSNVPNQTWDCLKLSGSQGNVVFTENVTLGSSISIGASKRGSRNIIPITGGTTSGKVKGKILSGGADYQLSGSLDARYTILTDDGEYIIIRNCGSGTLIPVFETSTNGPYSFLNENKYISSAPGMGSGGVSITFYEIK